MPQLMSPWQRFKVRGGQDELSKRKKQHFVDEDSRNKPKRYLKSVSKVLSPGL